MEEKGNLADLTQAIEHSQEAVDLNPAGNPNRAGYLNNLSNRLSTRYGREGNLADLAQAIEHSQEAVDLTPVGNPHRASHLNNLSLHLSTRYEREGNLTDLAQAIEHSQEAVDLTPVGNPHRASHLNNLSLHLSTRYEREGNLAELTQAIEHSQEAVDLTPADNPDRATHLNSLSIHLSTRYEREGNLADLAQAIEHSQEAVDLTPAGNPNRAGYLNNLSNRLSTRYGREGNLADLAQAIEHSQEAVDLTPAGNPNRAGYLNNLSNRLSTRYEREGDPTDITQAIEQSENAINCLNSPPSIRVRGCVNAMNYLAQVQRWPKARTLLDRGLEILPLLISNLSSKLDQENMMKSVSGLAAIGCAVSLDCNDDGFEAVRILELTRGTINRLAINSAAEISALSRLPPSLAKQYEELSALINRPVKGEDDQSRTSLSREAAVSKLHDLIELIRRETEFSDFPNLLPKTELLETSSDQVIVILNTTEFRTDALLIRSNDMVQVLPLSKSAFRSSNEYYDGLCGRFGFNQHQTLLAWVEANEETRRGSDVEGLGTSQRRDATIPDLVMGSSSRSNTTCSRLRTFTHSITVRRSQHSKQYSWCRAIQTDETIQGS